MGFLRALCLVCSIVRLAKKLTWVDEQVSCDHAYLSKVFLLLSHVSQCSLWNYDYVTISPSSFNPSRFYGRLLNGEKLNITICMVSEVIEHSYSFDISWFSSFYGHLTKDFGVTSLYHVKIMKITKGR